jgi:hypothetical protein
MAPRSKKPVARKVHRWRITRLRGTPAAYVGEVEAPDEETAIKKAGEEFDVPQQLRFKLIAQRID